MKTIAAPEKYLTIALAVMALLLAGVLYWEWDQGLRLEQDLLKLRKIPVTPVAGAGVLPEFALPDAETGFPELISRSLFSPSRRSSASAVKGGRGSMRKGQFALVGVLITPNQRSALLRDVQTNKTETVALVGVVRGMTLGEVESSRVVLRQGAESEELILNVQTGPRVPGVPQPPGAPVPQPVAAPPAPIATASAPATQAASAAVPPTPPASAASAPARAASGPRPTASEATAPPRPVQGVSAPQPSPNVRK